MKTVCDKNKCCGCYGCVNVCNRNAIRISDSGRSFNAIIDADKCVNCGKCVNICQMNNEVDKKKPVRWLQGWAEETIREESTSGGFATDISKKFAEYGVVISCVFKDGEFVFDACDSPENVGQFAGSKYVKSNMSDAYLKVRYYLDKGNKVLFIGILCQAAEIKRFFGEEKNLYVIDIICHGAPSKNMLNKFLRDKGYDMEKLKGIYFRKNANKKGIPISHDMYDMYSLMFLNGIGYTESCYSCKYATVKRVSDITLGDSWGSDLGDEKLKKGISLALVQTEKGLDLINQSGVHYEEADKKKAVKSNEQLRHCAFNTDANTKFFDELGKKKNFDSAARKAMPALVAKQYLKMALSKTGIKKDDRLYEVRVEKEDKEIEK